MRRSSVIEQISNGNGEPSPPTYRRSSSDNGNKKVDDLIYRFQSKSDIHQLQQLLATSPQLQRELALFYEQQQHEPIQSADIFQRELSRRMHLRRNNDSLTSLTDSEFYSDDQRVGSNNVDFNNTPGGIAKEEVAYSLTRVGRFLDMLSHLSWPRMSFTAMGICFLVSIFISPRACVQSLLFPAFRLVFGTLYPAYASYKAVRTKNVKEYVKWMMYWIVFAFFTCIETFTDIFLSWLPLYYEVKVIVVLWLLNPATKGSSVLYRKFVHPMLTRREQEIDEYLNQAKERGYTAVIQLGSKGVNYATNVIMQTALKGGGNLVQTIRRSYSLSDLSEPDLNRTKDEVDEISRSQHRGLRPRTQVARSSSSGSRHSTGMYFSEIDVASKSPVDTLNYNIRSSEDISSGYSSAEPISGGLSRTSSMTSTNKTRFKAKKPDGENNISENDENELIMGEKGLNNNPQLFYNPKNPLPPPPPYSDLNSPFHKAYLEDLKEQAYLDSERLFSNPRNEMNNSDQDKNDVSSASNSDNMNLPYIPPEMQTKFEMFCQWLDKNEHFNNEINSDESKFIKKDISDDDFKDTISIESAEPEIERFDDVEAEKEYVQSLEIKKDEGANDNYINQKDIKDDIKVDEANTEIKKISNENILKSEARNDLIENEISEHSEHSVTQPFKIESAPSNYSSLSSLTSTSDTKKPASHTKGKAPEPPPFVFPSLTSNLSITDPSSSSAFNTIMSTPRPSSPLSISYKPSSTSFGSHSFSTITTPKSTTPTFSTPRPSSPIPIKTSSPIASPKFITPIPSPSSSVKSTSPPTTPKITSRSSSSSQINNSRSPSPKPIQEKRSRRNIFRSYLPSMFRSGSPKSKPDDEYHKETEI